MVQYSNSWATLVDHMGSDKTVVNAARVSFAKDDELAEFTDKDEKLIRYLAYHQHWSPFAHTSIQFKIRAPIFVARQLVKHQVGGVWNEISRRYVDFEPEFYRPDVWRGRPVNAKQGSTGATENQAVWFDNLNHAYTIALEAYDKMIESGVAPEQARMVLPQGAITEWYWTGSLVFWDRVCKQRLAENSQEETRLIAKMISDHCRTLFPVSWLYLQDI